IYGGCRRCTENFLQHHAVKPGGADREDKSPAIIIEAWTAGENRKQYVYIYVLKNELITKIKA
ncbi:hypothetical protein, partial [Salmonella enterica]|uniref:hypothetical protein n=1 Tax=Salmonella enterica TaxID=28901 RepID=UPI001C707E95